MDEDELPMTPEDHYGIQMNHKPVNEHRIVALECATKIMANGIFQNLDRMPKITLDENDILYHVTEMAKKFEEYLNK